MQAQVVPADEMKLIQARSAAQFALTPIGQQVKQFEVQQRMAQMYVTSTIVPDTYKNNIGNCVIAVDMAMRMNANPLMVMQNLDIIKGKPSFSSKFLIATINASGRYSPLRYEFRGKEGTDSWACRVFAYETYDKEHKEPLYGDWVSIEMAKKEGWTDKSGSKWNTMPGQMLRYRAAAFWQRVYCPEIAMGLMTSEEYEDIEEQRLSVEKEIKENGNKETIGIKVAAQEIEVENPDGNANVARAEDLPPATAKTPQEKPIEPTENRPLFMQD